MIRDQGTAIINVPPEVIFSLIIDPAYLPRLLRGNLADAYDVKPLPGGGYSYRWVYRLAGLPIQAQGTMTELVRPIKIVVESSGGLKTVSTWHFEPHERGASATFSIEAPDVNFLLRRLSGRFIQNQLRFAVDTALSNVKHIAETAARDVKVPRSL